MSLLTKIRLKWNEGAQRTSWRVRNGDNETIPIWVMGARLLSRGLIVVELVDVMEDKRLTKLTMWFVTPLSNIQELLWKEKVKQIPERWVVEEALPTWFSMAWGLRRARNCLISSVVKGKVIEVLFVDPS